MFCPECDWCLLLAGLCPKSHYYTVTNTTKKSLTTCASIYAPVNKVAGFKALCVIDVSNKRESNSRDTRHFSLSNVFNYTSTPIKVWTIFMIKL